MDEFFFRAANAAVAPIWALMIFAPGSAWTERVVRPLVAPAIVAALYLYLVLTNMGATDGGFFSLDDVCLLFENRRVVLTGWVHYLSFDLVVGSLLYRDARRLSLPHLAVAPCLGLTLFWGPIGLLAYLALRVVLRRDADLLA